MFRALSWLSHAGSRAAPRQGRLPWPLLPRQQNRRGAGASRLGHTALPHTHHCWEQGCADTAKALALGALRPGPPLAWGPGLWSPLPQLSLATSPPCLPQDSPSCGGSSARPFLPQKRPLDFLGQLMGHLTLCCAEEDQEISHGAAEALHHFYRVILLRQSKRSCGRLPPSRHHGASKARPGATLPQPREKTKAAGPSLR